MINSEDVLPEKNILLGALNNDTGSLQLLLQYYLPYVKAAASFPIYDEAGYRKGTFVCDDLIQDMQIAIVHAVDVLRVKLSKR